MLVGRLVAGTYTLVIVNAGTQVGTLNSWSLTFGRPLSTSGLGEAVADQASESFRIFTADPTNAVSTTSWTAVGPGADHADGGRPDRRRRGRQHRRRRPVGPVGEHGLRRRRLGRGLEDDRLPDDQPGRADLRAADRLRPEPGREHRQHRRLPPGITTRASRS